MSKTLSFVEGRALLALVAAAAIGCVAPRVDVDTRGLRSGSYDSSASRPSSSTSSSAEVQNLKKDVDKLDKKLDDLKDKVEKLEDRVEKLEDKLD